MICVLDVKAGPARGRRFWIRADETLAIGRISTADFSVPSDRHMSRHHLILEGKDHIFRVRDVGSANGTFVNDAKVSTIELCDGDSIKAGETIFEVSVIQDSDNPHAKDLNFAASPNKTVQSVDEGADASQDQSASPLGNNRQDSRQPAVISDLDISVDDSLHAGRPFESISEQHWWAEFYFSPSSQSNIFQQSSGIEDLPTLSDILRRLEPYYAFTAIVNTENVDHNQRLLLDNLVANGVVTAQGPTVCSIMNSCSQDFYSLLDELVGRDSLVVLGTQNGLAPVIIADVALKSPRPSQVLEALETNSQIGNHIRAEIELCLFEQETSDALCMFLRDN